MAVKGRSEPMPDPIDPADNAAEWHRTFARLTRPQKRALASIAFGGDGGYCHPKTLANLASKGLIEPTEDVVGRGERFPVAIMRYDMPLHVHAWFCDWCSTLPEDE